MFSMKKKSVSGKLNPPRVTIVFETQKNKFAPGTRTNPIAAQDHGRRKGSTDMIDKRCFEKKCKPWKQENRMLTELKD